MSDILSQGRDREPRGPRRWWRLAAVTVGIVAVVGAIFSWHLPNLGKPGARPGPAAARPGAALPGEPGSPVAGPSPPPGKPAQMTGRPLPRDASVWLLLGGHRPAWLSVATGRTEPIRGLPRRGNGYQLIGVGGGWAAQPFPPGTSACASCAPRPPPVYYVADGSRAASRVGAADFAAPAASSGALWLVSYRPGADMRAAAATAQEVSVTGSALGPRLRLPAGYVIDRATRAGLLLVPELAGPGPVRYELWDAGTRRVTLSLVHLIAASPDEIAWMPACTVVCRVHVLHLPGGHVDLISLPGRSQSYEGAFSPDGRLLALQVTARITAGGRAAATRLVVATVASGRLTAVPGTTVGIGNGVSFGWQAGSRRLIADVAVRDEWQVAVWRPGDSRLSTALARAPYESWPVVDQGPY